MHPSRITGRHLYERHADPQAPLPLEDLQPDQLSREEDPDEKFYTTSAPLIDALGPDGSVYGAIQSNPPCTDLAPATDENEPVSEDAEELRTRHGPSRGLEEGAEEKIRGKKRLLVDYLRVAYANSIHDDGRESHGRKKSPLDMWLLEVFNSQTLKRNRISVTNIIDWAWILTAKTSSLAAFRLDAVTNRPLKNGRTFKPLPNFIFVFLLRRQDINAQALRTFIEYAWKLMGSLQRSSRNENGGLGLEDVTSVIKEGGRGMTEHVFILMIFRLVHHARRVWPASCESIVALFCHYMNGFNFRKFGAEAQNHHQDTQLSTIYNNLLHILSMPSKIHPFVNSIFQQRAQFSVLRRMDQFQPPLPFDARGARAVVAIQLMHKKTPQEQEWARMKAKSWPPCKEDRLGLDATIGPEYGISRAREALSRLKEAGYAAGEWEDAASILSGWNTDESPTIQTRSILTRPQIDSQTGPLQNSIIWYAHIRATRTIEEAWSGFLTCQDQSKPWPVGQSVYLAMFEKLSKEHSLSEEATDNDINLPGDGIEVWPAPAYGGIYVRQTPPMAEELLQRMEDDGIRPTGRLLYHLLAKAWSFEAGLRSLKAADVSSEQQSFLLGAVYPWAGNRYLAKDVKTLAESIQPMVLEACICFLARFAPRMPDTGAFHPRQYIQTGISLESHDLDTTQQMTLKTQKSGESMAGISQPGIFNPLLRAMQLLYLWRPMNRRVWYEVLASVARPKAVTTSHSKFALQDYQDIKTWGIICEIAHAMSQTGLSMDLDGFLILCQGLEKAIFAGVRLKRRIDSGQEVNEKVVSAVNSVLDDGLPFLQITFREIVGITGMQQNELTSSDDEKKLFEQSVEGLKPAEGNLRAFPPPANALPTLLEIPHPAQLHAFIRILGLRRDYSGLLDLVKWMSLHASEIDLIAEQTSNGQRMMRRCITAARVFLERSWLKRRKVDGTSPAGHDGIVIDAEPAEPGIIEAARTTVMEIEEWGGWATDGEVEFYCDNGRFL